MNISTTTDKVKEVRKFVIDLILSMHPLDCMTCTKAGVCNLQQYAYDFEIKESSFTRKKFGYPTDEANPFIKRDPEYCVLCSRCIRVCKAQGTNVLEFSGRGVGAKVVTANDAPLQDSTCTFCGNCVDACPSTRSSSLTAGGKAGMGIHENRFCLSFLRERLQHRRQHKRRRSDEDKFRSC